MTDWKAELQQGFTPPPPAKKREFLRQFPSMPISLGDVLLSQLGYIQTWVWVLSGVIYAAAALMLLAQSPYLLHMLSTCAPLLALTVVSESSRSVRFGMAELELSTRFSLKTVVLARLIPLGCIHPLGLLLLSFGFVRPLAAILYSAAPFLLTAFLGLSITRKYRSHEAQYACGGFAFAISLLTLFSHRLFAVLYEAQYLIWWVLAVVILAAATGKLYKTILFETEELAWN